MMHSPIKLRAEIIAHKRSEMCSVVSYVKYTLVGMKIEYPRISEMTLNILLPFYTMS